MLGDAEGQQERKHLDVEMSKVEEFKIWWEERLRKEQLYVKTPLYHYTNAAGLLGILGTGNMWFTSMYHVNDPSEVRFGRDTAMQILRKLDTDLDEFCEDYLAFISRQSFRTKFEPFVACFSRKADVLGQWRAYGDNGRGYAIGFKPSVFEVKQTELRADSYWITDVAYGDRATPLIREPIGKWLKSLKGDRDAEKDHDSWMTALTLVIMWYSLRVKHDAYKQEEEIRLVMQNGGSLSLASNIKFRTRGSSIVPFVPRLIDVKPENIHEVVIGPAADHAAVDALHTLAEAGLLHGVKIRKSTIPYAVV